MSPRATHRTRVKMCGMTSVADIARAVEAGADAIGVITASASPRRVRMDDTKMLAELAEAVPPFVTRVGVVTDPSTKDILTLRLVGFTLQFSGEELPSHCESQTLGAPYIKAFHLRAGVSYDPADFEELSAYTRALWMFDSRVGEQLGGTGVPFHWELVRSVAASRPIVVSGGLTPENVAACVRLVRPFAVDVRSGIETDGKKDAEKMHAFVRAVRDADADTDA